MKTLMFRLTGHHLPSYSDRWAGLTSTLSQITSSIWDEPTSGAVFIAPGDARSNHDQLRIGAGLLDDDLLVVIDHAAKTYCGSGGEQRAMLQFLAKCQGYQELSSQAAVIRALMARPAAPRGNTLMDLGRQYGLGNTLTLGR